MDESNRSTGGAFEALVELIARLRAPGGCPWDREQTHASLKPMLIEEAYEVLQSIDEGDDAELAGELGDILLQVVFHSQIAAEQRRFDVKGVIEHVTAKMVRRHPHVFGGEKAETSGAVLRNWEALKADEQRARGKTSESMLESVPVSLPAVMEAFQVTTKVSRVGFDWPNAGAVLDKVEEEVRELRAALSQASGERAVAEEIGDLLFVVVNLARLAGTDPESALKAANRKFRRRFAYVEARLRERGRVPAQSTLAEMDELWEAAKRDERER